MNVTYTCPTLYLYQTCINQQGTDSLFPRRDIEQNPNILMHKFTRHIHNNKSKTIYNVHLM